MSTHPQMMFQIRIGIRHFSLGTAHQPAPQWKPPHLARLSIYKQTVSHGFGWFFKVFFYLQLPPGSPKAVQWTKCPCRTLRWSSQPGCWCRHYVQTEYRWLPFAIHHLYTSIIYHIPALEHHVSTIFLATLKLKNQDCSCLNPQRHHFKIALHIRLHFIEIWMQFTQV